MIKESSKGRRAASLLLAFATALALGCGGREEAAETLDRCGNHSCGDLVMITPDVSPSGWRFYNPAVSPDLTRIAFSTELRLIDSWLDDQEPPVPESQRDRRMVYLIPLPEDPWADEYRYRFDMTVPDPVESIELLGAEPVMVYQLSNWIGGFQSQVPDAILINKERPIWVDNNTLILLARFGGRDRFLIVDVTNPSFALANVLFYEPDDLLISGGWLYYHSYPALDPIDGRWLLFSRFGCDREPNAYEPGYEDNVECTKQSLWVLDMQTIVTEGIESPDDFAGVVAFPLTSGAIELRDPAWSPDGRMICFAATTDLIGQNGRTTTELFSIRFDPQAAAEGPDAVVLDANLRRLTTTTTNLEDPIVGLHNYAPTFCATGREIFFVSTRRVPTTTMRNRSIWRIPFDGRLEPEILFFSRRDDVDPSIVPGRQWIVFSSLMGFPSYWLDAYEQYWLDVLPTMYPSMTEVEIGREARDKRRDLELYEGVQSDLFLYRVF